MNISGVDVAASAASPDLLTHRYAWDFGDTTAGSRHNNLIGFNAAHVYDVPGTYAVTLREYDGNGDLLTKPDGVTPIADPVSVTISGAAADQLAPVYIKENGSGTGEGATQGTAINIARLKTLLAGGANGWTDAARDNRKYLFFTETSDNDVDVGNGLDFGDVDNVIIGSLSPTAKV